MLKMCMRLKKKSLMCEKKIVPYMWTLNLKPDSRAFIITIQ